MSSELQFHQDMIQRIDEASSSHCLQPVEVKK